MSNNAYLLQMVRAYNQDLFWQSLFVPKDARDRIFALLVLDAELCHVRSHVSEEMLVHIRYAWWEESLAAIAEGKKPREHPVLQVVAGHMLASQALQLVQNHRKAYPETLGIEATEGIVSLLVPAESQENWHSAGSVIRSHRARYGKKYNSWLIIKLLLPRRS